MYFNHIPKKFHVVVTRDGERFALDHGVDEITRLTLVEDNNLHPYASATEWHAQAWLEELVEGDFGQLIVESDTVELVEACVQWPVIKMGNKWYSPKPNETGMYEVEVHLSHADQGYSLPDLLDQLIRMQVSHYNVHGRLELTVKGKQIQSVTQWMGDRHWDTETFQLDTKNPVSRFFKITDRKWENEHDTDRKS